MNEIRTEKVANTDEGSFLSRHGKKLLGVLAIAVAGGTYAAIHKSPPKKRSFFSRKKKSRSFFGK